MYWKFDDYSSLSETAQNTDPKSIDKNQVVNLFILCKL